MSSKTLFHVSEKSTKINPPESTSGSSFMPANVYGLKKPSQSITISAQTFRKLYEEEGDTGVIYLQMDGAGEEPVLIDEVQVHPVSGEVRHVAFRRVDLTEKIEADIEIEMVGINEVEEATVVLVLDEIKVMALPTDFPEKFEVDISTLTEIGQSINISDLNFDRSKVELMLSGDTTEDSPVAILQEVKEEVVEEEVTPDDVEITGEKPDAEEGAEGAEASDKPAADKEKSADQAKKDGGEEKKSE